MEARGRRSKTIRRTRRRPSRSHTLAEIPLITDEDRAAAFPKLNGQHAVHDDALHYYVLFDQLEWQAGDGWNAGSWDNTGWICRDVNRFWFRTEGGAENGDVAEAQARALFGRAIHPWWEPSHQRGPGLQTR